MPRHALDRRPLGWSLESSHCHFVEAADPPPPKDTLPMVSQSALPGGFFIVVGGKPSGGKGEPVILTGDQYKDAGPNRKLQAQLNAGQPVKPRSCELEGKVELRGKQPVVRLRATFKFTTTRPGTIVYPVVSRTSLRRSGRWQDRSSRQETTAYESKPRRQAITS